MMDLIRSIDAANTDKKIGILRPGTVAQWTLLNPEITGSNPGQNGGEENESQILGKFYHVDRHVHFTCSTHYL